ncbi:hypothetical protein HD806DRAFT_532202 [Xylariaceae sp. AK1471]|nr:hypothetical protein HD806DRAFT_532202 [Xylariaceae sp. AK1471]
MGSALESDKEKHNADKPVILGCPFAAAINQQGALEKLYKLASLLHPDIDGLARSFIWWAETTTVIAHDKWIEVSTKNVAKALIPMIEALKARSQATK